jgi:hypothetical protein
MQEVLVTAVSFSRRALLVGAALALSVRAVDSAGVCGAQVTVRQIKLTPNADGTRTVRYRASVQTDQPACAVVSFTIIRSYIKPDGAAFEDAIPVEVDVPGRVDVEADTIADTRRLIYWRAEKVTCRPCAGSASNAPAASAPSAASSAAGDGSSSSGEAGWNVPRVGTKTVIAGGAAAAVVTGAVFMAGGSGGATGADSTPTPRATAVATATATATATVPPAPTTAPSPTPAPTPTVFAGAPPASPGSSVAGDITLLGSDPVAGSLVGAARNSITVRLQLYSEIVGSDNRLELQLWSGGQMCVRDTSAPLEIVARQPYVITFPMANARTCTAPFRTTLMRVFLNDRGTPKLAFDFPIGFDFVP